MRTALPVDSQAVQTINTSLQIILFIAMGISPLLFSPRFSELFEFPKMVTVYGLAIVAVGLLSAKWFVAKQIALYQNPILWLLVIFLGWVLLTGLTGLNLYTSLVGYYTRFNGSLASYLAYAILFYTIIDQLLSSANKSFLRQLLYVWLTGASIVSIWGIFEHFGHDPSCLILRGTFTVDCWVPDVQARVFATLGQPNWLAAYLIASLPIAIGLLATEANKKIKTILCIAALIVYAAFWYTYSRAGWLGLGSTVLLLVFCLPWRILSQHRLWLGGIIIGSLIISLTSLNMASLRVESSLSGQGDSSSTSQMRLMLWDGALEVIKHNPLLGTGPETFAYSFQKYRPQQMNLTDEWNFLYNEAHNQVIDTAASLGIPGLILWLVLFLPFLRLLASGLYQNIRGKNLDIGGSLKTSQLVMQIRDWLNPGNASDEQRILSTCLASGAIGVFIAQLLGFAVVTTNLLLFASLAAVITPYIKTKLLPLNQAWRSALACVAVTAVVVTSSLLWRFVVAESVYAVNPPSPHAQQSMVNLNPYEPQYRLRLAATYIAGEELNLAYDQLQAAQKLNPYDLIVAKHATFYYRQMAQKNADWQGEALTSAQHAVSLSPTDASALQDLADTQLTYGLGEQALATYNRLIEFRPHAQSYLKRAEYYQLYGPMDKYKQDLEKALELDPKSEQAQELLRGIEQ